MSLGYTKTFKPKRAYHKTYLEKDLVEQIFGTFELNDGTKLTQIAKESHIPYDTIKYWKKQYQKDHNYRSGSLIGQHLRIFSYEEEKQVALFIRNQYLDHGIPLKRKYLRKILFFLWQSFDLVNRQRVAQKGMFSYTFLRTFCKRNGFSFREMRSKKRCDINPNEVELYTKEMEEIVKNMD